MAEADKKRLGELLLDANVIDAAQLATALHRQRQWGGKLGRILLELGYVSEAGMVAALSQQLGLPAIDLETQPPPPDVLTLLRPDICERYGGVPVGLDAQRRTLSLATSDPTNYAALDELGFLTGYRIQPLVAGPYAIDRVIRRYYLEEAGRMAPPGTPQEGKATLLPTPPPPAPEIGKMIEQLERRLEDEVRALRAAVELLIDRGLFRRDEYLQKLREL